MSGFSYSTSKDAQDGGGNGAKETREAEIHTTDPKEVELPKETMEAKMCTTEPKETELRAKESREAGLRTKQSNLVRTNRLEESFEGGERVFRVRSGENQERGPVAGGELNTKNTTVVKYSAT